MPAVMKGVPVSMSSSSTTSLPERRIDLCRNRSRCGALLRITFISWVQAFTVDDLEAFAFLTVQANACCLLLTAKGLSNLQRAAHRSDDMFV